MVYVVWGSTYLAIRVGVGHLPPLLMAGTRYVIAGALLYPVALRARPAVAVPAGAGAGSGLVLRRGWPAPSSACCCWSRATAA